MRTRHSTSPKIFKQQAAWCAMRLVKFLNYGDHSHHSTFIMAGRIPERQLRPSWAALHDPCTIKLAQDAYQGDVHSNDVHRRAKWPNATLNSGSLLHSCASSSRSRLVPFLAILHALMLSAHALDSFHFRNTALFRAQYLQHTHAHILLPIAVQTHPSHVTDTSIDESKACSTIACGLASTRHASIAAPRHVVYAEPTFSVKKYLNSLHPAN
ncbi:hypothetical protein TRVL_03350 [Trypanosoma vivax]|nr:hypothetical protein TRVL_03350 [Trypanosoma vivax]